MSKAEERALEKYPLKDNPCDVGSIIAARINFVDGYKQAEKDIYEWLTSHYRDYMYNPTGEKLEAFFGMDMITDLKQTMKYG